MHQLWIMAGPNGSGKTTFARRHLVGRLPIVNPDEIARELNPARPFTPENAIKAGRLALEQQERLLAEHRSFALETTFSGNRELAFMRAAKAEGYKVNLIFICTGSPLISTGRIALRTEDGEHFVPREDVERRYHRSLGNLAEGVALADRAWLIDNTGKTPASGGDA